MSEAGKSGLPLNQIIQGDCMAVLTSIPDKTIDCIIADPAYNIGKAEWDEAGKVDPFHTISWLLECARLLKPSSYLWVTAGCVKVSEIELAIRELKDIQLKNCIIWYRKDGWKGNNHFAQSHEHILLAQKSKIQKDELAHFIDYLNLNRERRGFTLSRLNEIMGWATTGGGNASNWMGDKASNSLPTLNDYRRLKHVLGLDARFDHLPFPQHIKIRKVEEWDDVWVNIRSEKGKRRTQHPTQKPEKLISRMIMSTTDEGDVVLDPFLGSGTTAVACLKLRRKFIGIEINSEYCRIAEERIRPWLNQTRLCESESGGVA